MLMRNDRVIGAVGSMIIWGIYFIAVYVLQGLGCAEGWHEVRVVGAVNTLTLAMVALTLVALALIAWNGWRGWQGWRGGARSIEGTTEAPQRHKFLGLLMLWLAGLSIFATILIGVPIVMLLPCVA